MKTSASAWQRLAAAARHTPEEIDAAAPFGFSTRVAALALASEQSAECATVNPFWWRALGAALALMIFSVAANYSSISLTAEGDQDPFDPVAEVLTAS
jgi:hypothetical protein